MILWWYLLNQYQVSQVWGGHKVVLSYLFTALYLVYLEGRVMTASSRPWYDDGDLVEIIIEECCDIHVRDLCMDLILPLHSPTSHKPTRPSLDHQQYRCLFGLFSQPSILAPHGSWIARIIFNQLIEHCHLEQTSPWGYKPVRSVQTAFAHVFVQNMRFWYLYSHLCLRVHAKKRKILEILPFTYATLTISPPGIQIYRGTLDTLTAC